MMKVRLVRMKVPEKVRDIFEDMKKMEEEISEDIDRYNYKYNYSFYKDGFPNNKLYYDFKNKKK